MVALKDKVVVITGASSGIGEKVAVKVAQEGAVPVLLARTEERLQRIVNLIEEKEKVKATYYCLDIRSEADIQTTFNTIMTKFGKIDILINNAGFGVFDNLAEADFIKVKEMFEVNVLGLIACTQTVLPKMLEKNSGHIINIASQAGKIATPKSSGYAATKHAVLGFSNSLRLELMDTNIFVSTVNPGPVKTRFFELADQSGEYVKNIEKFMLDPDYVASQIVKLIIHPKRELNLPRWMGLTSTIYQIMPGFVEKIGGKAFRMK